MRPYNKACPRTSLGSQPTVTLRQLRLGRLTRIAADLCVCGTGRRGVRSVPDGVICMLPRGPPGSDDWGI